MSKSNKPRLALLGKGTLDAGGLGIPTMIDLCARLSADFEITFYSFLPINSSKVPSGVRVRTPVRMRLPGRIKYFLTALQCLIDHISSPFSLFFAVSTYPAGLWTVRLAKLVNRPSIVQLIATEAGTSDDVSIGTLSIPWQKTIALNVCRAADYIVLLADYQIPFAKKNLTTKNEAVVLPLRINPATFIHTQRTLSMPIQFVQVGFFGPIKDQHTLFRTFALVAEQIDCHLTVIGDGFDSDEVTELIKSLKIENKVTFTGYISNDALPERLKGMHILLHTAIFETGCGVIQEAMASGIVVAGTKVGILHDIGERFALTAPIRSPALLAKEILQLVNDADRYRTIAENAHSFITTYDCVWAYENYRRFLTGVVARHSNQPEQASS